MGLSKRTLNILALILVLQELGIRETLQLPSTSSDSLLSTLPLPSPLQAPSVIESKNKLAIRKCCGPGEIYNFNADEDIPDANRCVKYSISSSHPLSPALKKSQKISLLLGSKEYLPPQYSVEDITIDPGFPRNCTPDMYGFLIDRLKPEKWMADLFYALSSGQLLVPHKFQFLEFDSYCLEDYAEERDFKKLIRTAFVCSSQIQDFPKTAVDDFGKLRMDFIESDADAEMLASKFNGRRVIRKCCGHNESFDGLTNFGGLPGCRKNTDFVTLFFKNLQSEENSKDLFFRFGHVKCDIPISAREFQLNSNGSLEVKVDDAITNSTIHRLIPIDDYCLDDMVEITLDSYLPSATTYAMYCPSEEPNLMEPEFPDGYDELTEPPFTTESPLTEPPSTEPINTEPPFTEQIYTEPPFAEQIYTEPSSTELSLIEPESTNGVQDDSNRIVIPKCCSPGHVMHEHEEYFGCHSLWWPSGEVYDQPADLAKIESQSLYNDFQNFHNISSTVFVSNTTLSSCKPSQRQQPIPIFAKNSKVTPIFHVNSNNEISVKIRTLVENFWDVKYEIHPFCVEHLFFREEKNVYYNSQVFHCISEEPFKKYRPVILLISVAALLATFIIYFFVPASGAAKLVLQMRGQNKAGGNTKRMKSMAMVLTGRILLCHIISLSLAFACLAIIQLKLVETQENSCVAIGYITYWAFIASFSWLTVYCFDYYRIFSGSFKVSNDTLFIPYSAFGWGIPVLAMITTIITQFRSTSMGISDTVNPNIGFDRCWFPGGNSLASSIFFYVPVGVLLAMDIFFFLSLMFNSNLMHCWKGNQGTVIRSNRRSSLASKEHEDLKMATKLFFITGVPWIFEFIAHLYELKYGLYSQLYYFLEFSQLLNTSRGVFIFVNFILLNRDVRKFLWPRIQVVFRRKLIPEDSTETHHTHSEDTHSTNGTAASFVLPSPSVTHSETISSAIVEGSKPQSDDYSIL